MEENNSKKNGDEVMPNLNLFVYIIQFFIYFIFCALCNCHILNMNYNQYDSL